MRILVTGGAGFIGSHIADALLDDGHEVAILDDLSSGNRRNVPEAAHFAEGDIRDAETVDRLLGDFRPDVVSHQAAQVSVSRSTREPQYDASVNVLGSLNLLESSVRHGVSRFVFASTGGAIYGEVPEGERADIDRPPAPLSPYGCAKLSVESYLRYYEHEHGLPYTVLRYANVYGPRQDPHGEAGVVAIFARRLLAGEPIRINARRTEGDPGCVRDYVHVRDVVAANLAAVAGKVEAPVSNVATGRGTTTLELANLLTDAAGSIANITFGPRRPGDLERSVLAPSPTVPGPRVTLEEGIRETTEWFRRNAAIR